MLFFLIRVKLFNRIFFKIIFLIIAIGNLWLTSFWIFTINGYIVLVPTNFHGQIYIKMNDENSHLRIRPCNGVVILPVDFNGKLYTKSNFHISESQISAAEIKNGVFFESDQIKLVDFKIRRPGADLEKGQLLTATVENDSTYQK